MNNRSPDMCLCFVEDAATSSSCCGGMATVSVCLPSVWSDAPISIWPKAESGTVHLSRAQLSDASGSWHRLAQSGTGADVDSGSRSLMIINDSPVLMRVFHGCAFVK